MRPVAQPRHRIGKHGAYIPKEHAIHAYKEAIKLRSISLQEQPLQGALKVTITFSFNRSKSVKRKRPAVKPDIDNLVKAVLDACNGICYKDDAQVCEIYAKKQYGDDYTEVQISEISI